MTTGRRSGSVLGLRLRDRFFFFFARTVDDARDRRGTRFEGAKRLRGFVSLPRHLERRQHGPRRRRRRRRRGQRRGAGRGQHRDDRAHRVASDALAAQTRETAAVLLWSQRAIIDHGTLQRQF